MTDRAAFIDLDQLHGGPVFDAVLAGLNERTVTRRARRQVLRDTHRKLLEAQRGSWPPAAELEQRAAAMKSVMAAAAPEHPALPALAPQFRPPALPTTRSCVEIHDGYTQWHGEHVWTDELAHHPLPPWSGAVPVATSEPRGIEAAMAVGGPASNMAFAVTGTTTWVRAGSTGRANLEAQVFLNAHDYVFTDLFGGCEGQILVGGAVQQLDFRAGGAHEVTVQLDIVGEAETSLADLVYAGFEHWDLEVATINVTFPAISGFFYACSAWVEVDVSAVGLAAANADIAAVADPFIVCQ